VKSNSLNIGKPTSNLVVPKAASKADDELNIDDLEKELGE